MLNVVFLAGLKMDTSSDVESKQFFCVNLYAYTCMHVIDIFVEYIAT